MDKALNEFRTLEATLKATVIQVEMTELASFEPEGETEVTVFRTSPRPQPQLALIPEKIHFTKARSLNGAHRVAEHLEKALC